MPDINTLIQRMRYWCSDVSLGYSQPHRWDIRPGGTADCSSLVIHCLHEAGFDTGSATYTGDLSTNLTARGWARLPADGRPQAGDILLNDADHTAVYLGDGLLAQASISETGGIDGAPGDQTGGETNITPYYDYPWDCYLRYANQTEGEDDMATPQDIWSYTWNGSQTPFTTLYGTADHVVDIDRKMDKALAIMTAQQATIDTLAKAVGSNPTDIAATVRQAVKDKLDQLHITVEEDRP